MPSDETRRVLRTFGVAVTTYEDAVEAARPERRDRQSRDRVPRHSQ